MNNIKEDMVKILANVSKTSGYNYVIKNYKAILINNYDLSNDKILSVAKDALKSFKKIFKEEIDNELEEEDNNKGYLGFWGRLLAVITGLFSSDDK